MKWAIGGIAVFAALLIFLMFQSGEEVVHYLDDSDQTKKELKTNAPKNNSPVTAVTKKQNDPEQSKPQGMTEEQLKKAREVLKDEDFPMGASSYSGPRPLSEEEMDKMDEIFEGYEKGWDKEMRNLLQTELGLTEEDYGDYLKMRDGYEEDRLEAFESFHERMAEERGPHYSYSPTQEMVDFDKKLRGEYMDLFRHRYGEEAFARYMNALEKYNDKIRREADPNYGVINIEF